MWNQLCGDWWARLPFFLVGDGRFEDQQRTLVKVSLIIRRFYYRFSSREIGWSVLAETRYDGREPNGDGINFHFQDRG